MSRLLVDTHALLWWLSDDPALSGVARTAIADPGNEVLISTASVWEIAIKTSIGRVQAPGDLLEQIVGAGFVWLPISAHHAWRVRGLPMLHRDPFHRILVAQALSERLPVVTADARLKQYGTKVRW